ncbi:MAG: efflux transporter outer membrane subunit [Burkholderiaceae bacterium]|nr:efflux transporter outer membrane subunit [Sulfuritalea sp.]MCF8175525.1 efflux transporter outer membrane subunit [Burkholderiaceae bacterium]
MPRTPSLLLLLVLAGCSFTPDYQRPAAPIPAAWPAPGKVGVPQGFPSVTGETALAAGWRSYFPDSRLQVLIAAALEHNRDLRIAVARVDEARALAGIARADRFPTLDLAAQRSASLTPADLSGTGRQLNSQRYDVNLGVAAFELDFWGRVRGLDDAARASYLASDFAHRAFRLTLIADVANAYLSLLELGERLDLARSTLKSRDETRMLVTRRRDVGLAGDLDYLQADGAFQNARAEVASLARAQAAVENALRLLVGDAPAFAEGGKLALPGLIAELTLTVPAGLPSELLLMRPDVLAAEQKLIAANANIGAARAAFLPKILLTATLGTASRGLGGLFNAGSGAWSFNPVLRLPLFDSGRTEGNVDLAEVRKIIAVAEYEKAIQQAFREVADLLAARGSLSEQLQAQVANVSAQSLRLKIVEARYKAGVSSHLELLDAQREHFAAQQSALAVRRQLLSTAASFYKALGSVTESAD